MNEKNIELFQKAFLALDRAMGSLNRIDCTCFGVTFSQCHTITEIGIAGKTTIKRLTAILGLDKSTLSRTIDALVESGLVVRAPDPDDRRKAVLTLSEKGAAVFAHINSVWYRFCGELLDKIPENNHARIIDSMSILIKALLEGDLGKRFLKTCCM